MQLSPEDRDQLQQLMASISRHVAMAAFLPSCQAMPEDIPANGTVSFVQSPDRSLLVTNAHVWNEFLDMKDKVPDAELVLVGAGEPIAITHATPIAVDLGRDLAVFACDRPEEVKAIGKEFYSPKVWPIVPPEDGDDVVFVGFPGLHRCGQGHKLSVVASLLAPTVVSVSDRSIRLEFTNPDKHVEEFKKGLQPFGPLGGVSGSALYRLTPGTNALDLTGCVKEAGEDLTLIYAARLDCLNADGTLQS